MMFDCGAMSSALRRKRSLLPAMMLGVALLWPWSASSAAEGAIVGTIKGFRCVTDGVCAEDRNDPRIATESEFVLQEEGGDYYFVHNMERAVKARHALQTVRVVGDIDRRYKSIRADKMELMQEGSFRTIWTPKRDWQDRRIRGSTRP